MLTKHQTLHTSNVAGGLTLDNLWPQTPLEDIKTGSSKKVTKVKIDTPYVVGGNDIFGLTFCLSVALHYYVYVTLAWCQQGFKWNPRNSEQMCASSNGVKLPKK